ncbi:hypothetical protein CAEBREN_09938 [Caenorhabditis brenneri]|uniref:Uncharacterized protein n=1 Tax=Caenorhabditis brenneri TaxID=135651 RepID=G0MMG0_CAEBE|nr:hypothetical protein CAEBREN_09938 [Caenorhabditis brenneri]
MDLTSSRPISYDSLKILLQYAKPNLRFELSRRIPSIWLTEKAVPLRIDKLTIGSLGVEVNNIKYEAHTIRHFPPNLVVSKHFLYDSHEGDWDLDEWGFDDFSSETVFTPGDLVLQVEGQEPRRKEQDEEYRKSIELDSNFKTWLLAQKPKEQGSSSVKMQKSKSDSRLDSLNLCKNLNLTKADITPNLKSLIHPKQMIEDAEATFEGTKTENSIEIPVNNSSQIKVSYGAEKIIVDWIRLRLLTIEVVAA